MLVKGFSKILDKITNKKCDYLAKLTIKEWIFIANNKPKKEVNADVELKTLEKLKPSLYNYHGDSLACEERRYTGKMTSQKHKVKGTLQVDRGIYTVRARVYDPYTGEMHQRGKSTGLPVKGNKRRAEEMMKQIVADWEREANGEVIHADPLFSESVSLWIEHKEATLKESTITAYMYNVNGYILPRFGKMRTREINMYQIRSFYDELLKKGLSVKTVRKIHLIIYGVMEDAVIAGIRQDNPSQRIKLPAAQKFQGKAYTAEQANELIEVAKKEGEPIQAAIILGINYGLRRSEICGLRWSDIDFENNTITIRNTVVENGGQIWEEEKTKTAKSNRILDIGENFADYFKELKATHERNGIVLDKVCCWSDGRAVKPSYVSHRQKEVLEKYGLEKIRLHDYRHTAGSLAAKRGTLNQVRDFLGHEDISTTYNIYVHTNAEDRKVISGIMDDVFKSAEKCSGNCSGNEQKSNK